MNKDKFNALEKVFLSEINGRLTFKSKAKIYRKLVDEGLLFETENVMGDGPFKTYVRGYALTHAGRFRYCSMVSEEKPI